MSPCVSIIIPTYNHARYLPEAVRSIQAQTFTDWEIIIVDDGSTDDTSQIVEQIAETRARYIYQANAGLSAARNTGIHAAHGEYLVFLDADDVLEPLFLQTCLGVLQHDPTLAGVYTLNHFIDDRSNILPQPGGECVSRQAFRARNLQGGFFAVHAAVVRADVVHEVGLFDTRLTSEEDWDLWLRIADRYEMQCIAQPLVGYRVYPGSMSTNALRMHTNRVAVLTKHFGLPDGDPPTWNDDKRRAYGFAFRSTAFALLQQNQADEGWRYLTQAVQIWPALLRRVDTFYELICGDQPSGYRGQADQLNIECNGVRVLKWLDEWCAAQPIDHSLCQAAYSNAHLAMGMLNDQAGYWTAARSALRRALRANPRLILSSSFMRRVIKLYAGSRLIGALRKVSNTRSSPAN